MSSEEFRHGETPRVDGRKSSYQLVIQSPGLNVQATRNRNRFIERNVTNVWQALSLNGEQSKNPEFFWQKCVVCFWEAQGIQGCIFTARFESCVQADEIFASSPRKCPSDHIMVDWTWREHSPVWNRGRDSHPYNKLMPKGLKGFRLELQTRYLDILQVFILESESQVFQPQENVNHVMWDKKMWSFMTWRVRDPHPHVFFKQKDTISWICCLLGPWLAVSLRRSWAPISHAQKVHPLCWHTSVGASILVDVGHSNPHDFVCICKQTLALRPGFHSALSALGTFLWHILRWEMWSLKPGKFKVQGMVWVSLHSRECTGTIGHKMSSVWVSTY